MPNGDGFKMFGKFGAAGLLGAILSVSPFIYAKLVEDKGQDDSIEVLKEQVKDLQRKEEKDHELILRMESHFGMQRNEDDPPHRTH